MSNNKIFLFLGASLSLIPDLSAAQCVATQDCATLGYTETSCNGGKGVKCPFGNKWACLATAADFEQQFCNTYGFKYTCSSTGYSGGAGTACGGKYAYCNCASGYIWKNGKCVEPTCLNSQTLVATWTNTPTLKECIGQNGIYSAICIYYSNGCGNMERQGSRTFTSLTDCYQKWMNACYPFWEANSGLSCKVCNKYDI